MIVDSDCIGVLAAVKVGPLLTAVALAIFLVVRRRKLEPTLLIGGAIVAIGFVVYGSGLIELPNVEKLIEDAGSALGKWTYLVVAVAAFLETGAFVGLIAPGETFMVFGGVVAGQGRISLVGLIAIVWAAAIAGDVTSFFLGRRLGRAFLVRHGPKVQITEERLHRVEAFFGRHGGKAILLGRFVGLVRAIAPFLAGSSGMAFRRFIPYDIVGAGAWATAFLVLGYVFWQRFSDVLNYAKKGAFALGATIVAIVAVVWLVRFLRVPENRERLRARIDAELERPALRPLAFILRPLWRRTRRPRRFVVNRITPGDLGLEVTTLIAVAAVGSFAFVGYLIELRDVRFTTGDLRALDIADNLRGALTTNVAKVFSFFGQIAVVGGVLGLGAIALALRRRLTEAGTLVAGLVLVYVGVHLTKAAEDRPRPTGPLVDTAGSSFPSAHAAYAVAWIALAVIATRTVPGLARTTAAIIVAIVLAAAIGLSRIALRAHYLSDVLGGFGLAATIFALCGMVGLVVAHVRHNGRRT